MKTSRLLALPLTLAAVLAAAPTASATPPSARTLVIGSFNGPTVSGQSFFRTDGAGQSYVVSYLRKLTPGSAYFTVAYGNTDCDPAQAAPAGPVFADRSGRATLVTTISTGAADIAASGSVSVRMADTAADIDGDGIKGSIDVVAKVGEPEVGLIQCDTSPRVR